MARPSDEGAPPRDVLRMDVRELARMDIRDLVRLARGQEGRESQEEEDAPTQARSLEAHFVVENREGGLVAIRSELDPQPLFALRGRLAGGLGKFSEGGSGGLLRLRLQIPIQVPGRGRIAVRADFHRPAGAGLEGSAELIRTGRGQVPPSTQMLEFLFAQGDQELRYVFEMDQDLEVIGFREVEDRREIFRSIPPVAQMTAVLRAMLHQRRGTVPILADLVEGAGSEAGREGLAALRRTFPPGQVFGEERVGGLVRIFSQFGRSMSEPTLSAFTLFVDLERGALGVEEIGRLASQRQEPAPSATACLAVALNFGLPVQARHWDAHLGFAEESFEEALCAVEGPLAPLLARLRAVQARRTTLDILQQLAAESRSERVQGMAERLRSGMSSEPLAMNDEQRSLLALLEASGREVSRSTLMALCLFVDAEVGILGEEDVERLARAADTVDTSMYAMVAVAGAFDTSLRGFVLEGTADPLPVLQALLERAEGGLMACFDKPGVEGRWWEWLREPGDAVRCLVEGLVFRRAVLGRFPLIDQVSELDLAAFLGSGRSFLACFHSDVDRTLVWKKVDRSLLLETSAREGADVARGRFSFIEGYSSYNFSRYLIASFREVTDEELLGQERVVAVYVDNRGNRHYRCLERVATADDLAPPPHSMLEWTHRVVEFPDVSRLPDALRELGQERLLGRTEELSQEVETLRRLHGSLQRVLCRAPEHRLLARHEGVAGRIVEYLRSPEGSLALAGVMDARTREGLTRWLEPGGGVEVRVYRPAMELAEGKADGVEFLALRVLCELCASDEVQVPGLFKQYDPTRFRALWHRHLQQMLGHEDPGERALALRLLATAEELPDRNTRLVVEYELGKALGDPAPNVVEAASEGLSRVALAEIVPLPDMVTVRVRQEDAGAPPPPPPPTGVEGLLPGELDRVCEPIRKWVDDLRQSDLARGRSLPFTDDEGRLDDVALAPLAEVLAALNQACREDGSLGRRRYYCLATAAETAALRLAVLESWKVMALSQGRRLAELAAEADPRELVLDYDFFVGENAEALARELGAAPYLGGASRPLTLHHFRPSEEAGLWRRRQSSFVKDVTELSPFFEALLEIARAQDPRTVRILRVARAGGVPLEELENVLPVFVTDRRIESRDIEIFQPNRVRFAPLMHEWSLDHGQVGAEPPDLEDFQALVALHQGRAYRPRQAGAPAEPEPSAPEVEVEEVRRAMEMVEEEELEQARSGLAERARVLARTFSLPDQYDRQVINILYSVGRDSIYDL